MSEPGKNTAQEPSDQPPPSEFGAPKMEEPRAYGVWFLLAILGILIPFALILLWVLIDAPQFLFR